MILGQIYESMVKPKIPNIRYFLFGYRIDGNFNILVSKQNIMI